MADRPFRAHKTGAPETNLAIGTLHDDGSVDVMYRDLEKRADTLDEVTAVLETMSSTGVTIVWGDG